MRTSKPWQQTLPIPMLFSLLATPVLLLSMACAPPPPVSNQNANAAIVATSADRNGRFTVAKGQILTVRLPVVLGMGYNWFLASYDRDRLEVVGEPTIESPANSEPGLSENYVLELRARNSGTSRVELHYQRPWERNLPPQEVYRLEVTTP
jgi:inhibitor of cysteine peptidase